MRSVLIMLCALMLVSCGRSPLLRVDPPAGGVAAHELVRSTELQYLSCNEKYFGFLSDYSLEGAAKNYVFAMMASNTYVDDETPQYRIPGWTRTDRYESKTGLALDVYRRQDNAGREEFVVAYKGTDFRSIPDWRANGSFIEPRQFKQAYKHLAELRAAHPAAKVTATGHSLGGALALNMSLRFDNVPAVVFNTSPNLFFKNKFKRNERIHLYETGEILGPFNRTIVRVGLPQVQPYKYNFMDFYGRYFSPVPEHSMYLLSRGVLISAIHGKGEGAREAFVTNIDPALARKTEWQVCAPLYEASAPSLTQSGR